MNRTALLAATMLMVGGLAIGFGTSAGAAPASSSAGPAAAPISAQYDLSGEWIGTFNVTNGPDQAEHVMVYQTGNNIRAVKITGDRNVPAGKETFHGTYTSNPFSGQQQCAAVGFVNPSWSNMKIAVKDATHFSVLGGCGMPKADWSRVGNPVLALDDAILFDTAQFSLKPKAGAAIANIVQLIASKHPHAKMLVAGYTDNVGAAGYNLDLSRKRAESVAHALEARGITAARLTIVGYGMAHPRFPNVNDDSRAHNRRVEIVIEG